MTQSDIASSIVQGAELFNNAGAETNNLLTLLEQELSEALESNRSGLSKYAYFGKWEEYERRADSTWIFSDTSESLQIYKHSQSKSPARYLCLQVSLFGDGAERPNAQTVPLVHVALVDTAINFYDFYVNPKEILSDENTVLDRGQEGVLIGWGELCSGSWDEQQWCYSVELTSLNTLDDLRSKIIDPTVELLTGKEYSNIAMQLQDLEGVIHYSK